MIPSPGATKRPSFPGIVTSHVPSGCGSPITGPASDVDSDDRAHELLHLCLLVNRVSTISA
jgi:hypothetical protein